MKLTVMAQDIEGSVRGNPWQCAVARASNRQFETEDSIFAAVRDVGLLTVGMKFHKMRGVDQDLEEWMKDYDGGNPVKPITLERTLTEDV